MPSKQERVSPDVSAERLDDLETAALADYKAFIKRGIQTREDLSDLMAEARQSGGLNGSKKMDERQADFFRKVKEGEISILIMDAEEAMGELEKLHKEKGKHDPEHTADVLRNAARSAAMVEDALAMAIELGFERSKEKEAFNEKTVREKLADIEIGIMDGLERLKKHKSVHTKIRNNSSFMLYDNEFVDRLNKFDEFVKDAVDLSKQLKIDLKEVSDSILGGNEYNVKELSAKISDIEDKYGDVAAKVKTAEENVPAMEKEFGEKKEVYDRFFRIVDKINALRGSEDLKRVPRGIGVLNSFLPRLRDMRHHNLTEEEMQKLEHDFNTEITSVIEESRVKEIADREAVIAKGKAEQQEAENQKQIAELEKKYLPVLRVEQNQMQKMREQIAPLSGFGEYAVRHPLVVNIEPNKLSQIKFVEDNLWKAGLSNGDLTEAFMGKNKMPLREMRKRLADYAGEFTSARDGFAEAIKTLGEIKRKMIHDTLAQVASQRLLKNYLSEQEVADMEGILLGLEALLHRPEKLTWRDIDDIKFVLRKNVIVPLGEKIKKFKSQEAAMSSLSPMPPEKSPEELYAEVKPEMVVEEQPLESSVEKKPIMNKKEVIAAISEMYESEGIINLDARDIMNALTPIDVALFDYVRSDVKNKNQSGSEAFKSNLRDALKKGLLKSLDEKTRERLTEVVAEAAYAQLKGAVDAESQAEILRLQKTKLDKLARIGAVGVNIGAKVAFGIGLGAVGAPLITATGGLAAFALAPAMIGVSKGIDRLAETAAVKKVKSFFGKLFNRNKPAIDEAKVIEEKSKTTLTPEILAAVVANQLRENTSADMRRRMEEFAAAKTSAERTMTVAAIDRFDSAVNDSMSDFRANAYNYLSAKYPDMPEETLQAMAVDMALTIGMNQKNEIKTAAAAEKAPAVVRALDKITKFKSDTVGSIIFGTGMAAAATAGQKLNVPVVREIVSSASGAISGAGIGLMIEARMVKSNEVKISETTKNKLSGLEDLSHKNGAYIKVEDWNNLQNEVAVMRKYLSDGKYANDPLLKSRVENLISRFGRMTIERAKEGAKLVDNILADVAKQSEIYDKIAKKHEKKLMKIFGIKDRRTIFILAGAAAGAGLGYFIGTGGFQKIHDLFGSETPTGKTINFTDRDLQPIDHAHGVAVPVSENLDAHSRAEPSSASSHDVARHASTHHVPHPRAASHVEKVLTPLIEEPATEIKSTIPENPYGESGQPDIIEQELQKAKFPPSAPEHDVARHIVKPTHSRVGKSPLDEYLGMTEPTHDDAAHARAVKHNEESVMDKFKNRMGSVADKNAAAVQEWIDEPPKAAAPAAPVIEHAPEPAPTAPDMGVDAGVSDAGVDDAGAEKLSPENQKYMEEVRQRVEGRRILDENTLYHARQLGVERQYNWLQNRMQELHEEILDVNATDPNRDAKILELSDDLDRLRDLNNDLRLDMLNGDDTVSDDLVRTLNREMTAHGI